MVHNFIHGIIYFKLLAVDKFVHGTTCFHFTKQNQSPSLLFFSVNVHDPTLKKEKKKVHDPFKIPSSAQHVALKSPPKPTQATDSSAYIYTFT